MSPKIPEFLPASLLISTTVLVFFKADASTVFALLIAGLLYAQQSYIKSTRALQDESTESRLKALEVFRDGVRNQNAITRAK